MRQLEQWDEATQRWHTVATGTDEQMLAELGRRLSEEERTVPEGRARQLMSRLRIGAKR